MTDQLVEAIKQGDGRQVKALVAADPGRIRRATMSPILLSVYMGKPDITALLVEHVEALTLHEAAATGAGERVRVLVTEAQERVDEPGRDGFTPLGLAAYFGHAEVVALLLRHGADVDRRSQNSQGVAPLHSAISAGHGGVIDLLLAHGADVNVAQERGVTPLMQAAHRGDPALVQRLLARGADAAAKTSEGHDALWYARDADAGDVVALLQER